MKQQCISCGGIFDDVQRDGMQYFHACPPLSVAELKAAIVAKTLTFTAAAQAAYDAAKAADVASPPAAGTSSRVDAFLFGLNVDRPNKRDENIVPPTDASKPATIKSAGKGVQPAPAGSDVGATAV